VAAKYGVNCFNVSGIKLSASKMIYIVSGGALNSTHSLTRSLELSWIYGSLL